MALPGNSYDVFLSFRGEDTRKKIVSHLYQALQRKRIITFKDDENIRLGDTFPPILLEAIKSSKFAVVVLSEHYVNSRWCLDELHLIMKLKSEDKIDVIPVFYDVTPSEVKNFRDSFDLTGHRSQTVTSELEQALKHIGEIQGAESSKYPNDAMMVEVIAESIREKLRPEENLFGMEADLEQINPEENENLVGMEAHLEQINPEENENLVGMEADLEQINPQENENLVGMEAHLEQINPEENENLVGMEADLEQINPLLDMENLVGMEAHLEQINPLLDMENLVGMEAHLEQINPLLDMETHPENLEVSKEVDTKKEVYTKKEVDTKKDKVRMIGIWGMGGIGKTTIARHLYEQLKGNFSSHCFIEKVSSKQDDLVHLQEDLVSKILRENKKFENANYGSGFLSTMLKTKRALIVLDDVDDNDQLSALVSVKWFGPGSRIVITTRDKSCLGSSVLKYKVKYLSDDKALQLFQLIAFQGNPPPGDYKDLSTSFVKLAHGLPLALETFGKYLRDKSPQEWKDALEMFEEAPDKNIMKVFKSSYDKLNKFGKNAFLHVACLFNGAPVGRVIPLLERGNVGIKDLEEKALIDKTTDGRIAMHPLLEQAGRKIVCQKSRNSPAEQKILWHHDDIYQVLADNAGTNKTKAIVFDVSVMSNDLHIKRDVFRRMHNLRFLKIYKHSRSLESDRGNLTADSLILPQTIRFLHWDKYPLTTLSKIVTPDCLVELYLCHSKLSSLWDGIPKLRNLRKLDLTGSIVLEKLPDLKEAMCLEELILEGCTSLWQIPESICGLPLLQKINVSNCVKLSIKITESMSNHSQDTTQSVRSVYLKISGTAPEGISLQHPTIKGNFRIDLKHLKGHDVQHLSFIPEVPTSHNLMMLEPKLHPYCFSSLDIMRLNCNKKNSFTCSSFADFQWLIELNLINLNIKQIPVDIFQMGVLEKLDLSGNAFKRLPATMQLLIKLKHLTLCNCRNLEELPELYQLEKLTLSDCTELRRFMKLNKRRKSRLLEVWIDNCKNIESLSDELSHCTKLTYLDLSRQDFKTLPTSIGELTSLITLCLSYNNNLVSLTELPRSLKCLKAHGCKSLITSHLPIDHIDLSPCPHWKQNSTQITRFPAGRRGREVPICACLKDETTILPRNHQGTISIIWQRLNSWCELIAGVAILLVAVTVLLKSGSDPSVPIYLDALLKIYCFYIIITKLTF